MKTDFAFLNRFSLLRISWIEAEDIGKAIDIFREDWTDQYNLNDIMVMKQRHTLGGPRWDIIADSIQEWLDAMKAPVRFAGEVIDSIIS